MIFPHTSPIVIVIGLLAEYPNIDDSLIQPLLKVLYTIFFNDFNGYIGVVVFKNSN